MPDAKLHIGVAGLGRAFELMLPTFLAHPKVALVAAADPRSDARARFAAEFSARTYASIEELCADSTVNAIYVATPHQFHAGNVCVAAAHGKHVLVEKPMALCLEDCRAMIEATERAGVCMVVGHSHSFDTPVRRTRDIIARGESGALRMISALNYTDFLYRPRRPEELRTESGGGVVFNQAPHHVDMVRLLGGGMVRSVRAVTGAWDSARAADGAYSCLLEFEGGAFASLTYSGYAHFDSDELVEWIAESGYAKDPAVYGSARAALRDVPSQQDELSLKNSRLYGTKTNASSGPRPESESTRWHQHFGLLIASCERADLRPTPRGVFIYGDTEKRFEPLAPPDVPRAEVIDELWDAVFLDRPPLHGGAWGMATMEVCLAILKSSREKREIAMHHQVGV
ncbi:MAG TPA: Gfo/Idh/MocA family oxidoreductase, partial [Micropepsaceae bacterium]|nr:Gfo/Idh/MocA family oxidoreductase [Micropepsaceae bacterium]